MTRRTKIVSKSEEMLDITMKLWIIVAEFQNYEALVKYSYLSLNENSPKWNKIEHRLFCYISKNWQGKPLVDIQTAIDLIGSTTTTSGLKVICVKDETEYMLAQKVPDKDFKKIAIKKILPSDSWNYIISPNINRHVIS